MATPEELPERLRNHEQVQAFERNREAFRDDPYRPDYHFTPPGGTLHDPNGACYWNGRYHLFYQFWPPDRDEARPWDEAMHWGHAVSDDLLHWQDLPVALSAATGLERSCYSGQALVEDDRVVLMYHGPGAGNCIATSDDPFLATVEKHPDNPVVPIDEDAPYRVFDPCLWHEDGTYYSLSGSYAGGERGEDSRDVQFLFRSGDLSEWEYLGPLVEGRNAGLALRHDSGQAVLGPRKLGLRRLGQLDLDFSIHRLRVPLRKRKRGKDQIRKRNAKNRRPCPDHGRGVGLTQISIHHHGVEVGKVEERQEQQMRGGTRSKGETS
jgi:hypothetical protein